MNIEIQFCGLLVLLLLAFFCTHQRMSILSTGKLFIWALIVAIGSVSLDIGSVLAIENSTVLPGWFVALVCKAYLVSLVFLGMSSLIYTCSDIYRKKDELRHFCRGCLLLGVVEGVIIGILPIHSYYWAGVVYTYGWSVQCTYFFALGYVLLTICQVIRYRKRMNKKRLLSMLAWMLLWSAASLIQFMNNEYLLVGFASSLGIMILFFELENPQAGIDRETGAYNMHILKEYMRQMYESKERFSSVSVNLDYYQNLGLGHFQSEDIILQVVQFLNTFQKARLFKNVGLEFILIYQKEEDMWADLPLIRKRFESPWTATEEQQSEVMITPVYIVMANSLVVSKAEDVFRLYRYFKENVAVDDQNMIVANEEMIHDQIRRKKIENEIQMALAEDRIEVFYQPIYSIRQQRFVSAEALVRIRKRDGSMLAPGVFIPVAEDNGMILALGERVFVQVCEFIRRTDMKKYGLEYIEINLSVTQCEQEDLAQVYGRILQNYQIDPSCINLEITESASIRSRNILLKNMQEMIGQGISFSLDDFGNGCSNLNYIVDMPVQIVKFDLDMTQAYFQNKKAKFVMEAAMNMIHDMKLHVVSEGVETKEQLEVLTALGVDYIQGYYFQKPVPEQTFLQFLLQRNR